MLTPKFLFFLLALTQLKLFSCQSLDAIELETKLPIPRWEPSAIFDGHDSIVIVGSGSEWSNSSVFDYSIRGNSVQEIGYSNCYQGIAVRTGADEALCYTLYNEMWGFRLSNPSDRWLLGVMPWHVFGATLVWDGNEHVFVVGADDFGVQEIYRLNKGNGDVTIVGRLPSWLTRVAAVWVPGGANGDSIYMFGGHTPTAYVDHIIRFNVRDGSTQLLGSTLPRRTGYLCPIVTQQFVYLFGGYPTVPEGVQDYVTRFDKFTNEVSTLPVSNLPPEYADFGCAFVANMSRVFLFGGKSALTDLDSIYIVDVE